MVSEVLAVTGANGFLGRHCLRRIVKMGLSVRGLVRRREAAVLVEEIGGEAVVIRQLEAEALSRAFRGCRAVLHFIGVVNEDHGSFEEVNVRGTRLVLDCAEGAGVAMFVVPSGLGVDQYGKKDWATNGYFFSKRQVESICSSSSVPFVVFRPSYILGPGDELIPALVDALLSGTVYVAGDGNTPMQPVYVEDASEAFVGAAIGKGKSNSIYDLVGIETTTIVEMVGRVASAMSQVGYAVPDYKVVSVPRGQASEVMGLSREEVDVMFCDVLGDPGRYIPDFNISPTPLNEAIHSAVRAKRGESR